MDPFSITVGSVSLASTGITICDKLVSYCQSYLSRSNDLILLSQHAERLQIFLRLLEERQRGGLARDATLRSTVQACLGACGVCLQEFHTLNDRYSQHVPSIGLKGHGKAVVRKLQYPFQKEKFQSLRQQIHEFHTALSSQLLLMNYDITADLYRDTLCESQTLASMISLQGQDLSHEISNVAPALTQILDQRVERLEGYLHGRLEILEKLIAEPSQCQSGGESSPKSIRTKPIVDGGSDNDRTGASLLPRLPAFQGSNLGRSTSLSFEQNEIITRQVGKPAAHGGLLKFECFCVTGAAQNHENTCIYSFRNRKKRTIAGQIKLFSLLFKYNIVIQYSQYAFAKDFQVYPNLTLRATCDWSPAFELVWDAFDKMDKRLTGDDLRKELRNCLVGLRRSFTNGEAWPTDITPHGNLLHVACLGSRVCFTDETAAIFLQYLKELIAMGVPINESCGFFGITPLFQCLENSAFWTFQFQALGYDLDSTHLIAGLARELIASGAELPVESAKPMSGIGGLYYLSRRQRIMVGLSVPDDYGSLSCALLQESEPEVRRLLATSKLYVLERGPSGETPLHVTVCWARGIELLLELGGDDTRSIIDAEDIFNNTPLTYALQLGQFEAVTLLLGANARINLEVTRNIERRYVQRWNLRQSDNIITLMSYALADHRTKLAVFALGWLTDEEACHLQLKNPQMLQETAFDVIEVLRKRLVNIPWYHQDIQPGSIYHSLCMSVNLAEALFQAGFDHANVIFHGFSPLMTIDLSNLTHRRGLEGTLDLVMWFVNHGADLNMPIPHATCGLQNSTEYESRCFQTIHRIAFEAGNGAYRTNISSTDEVRIGLLRRILSEPTTDPCNCYCAYQGCTGASLFARGMWNKIKWVESKPMHPWRLQFLHSGVELVQHIISSGHVPAQVAIDVIRVSTFVRLGMQHTCCTYRSNLVCGDSSILDSDKDSVTHAILDGRYQLIHLTDPEEIEEIQGEDQHLAVRLEALVKEFDAKFTELGQPFKEFFFHYWWRRMDEVDAERDVLSSDDVEAILETGVVLEDG